jgi:hypothetical protein
MLLTPHLLQLRLLKHCRIHPKFAARAAYVAMYSDTVQQAWASEGIHPWSLEWIKASPYVIPTLPPEVAQMARKRKRSYITLSEKLITSETVISALETQRERKEKPKKPRGRPKKIRLELPVPDVSSDK